MPYKPIPELSENTLKLYTESMGCIPIRAAFKEVTFTSQYHLPELAAKVLLNTPPELGIAAVVFPLEKVGGVLKAPKGFHVAKTFEGVSTVCVGRSLALATSNMG